MPRRYRLCLQNSSNNLNNSPSAQDISSLPEKNLKGKDYKQNKNLFLFLVLPILVVLIDVFVVYLIYISKRKDL
jgi:lipopolysaccharide export LptBFGC system permease protein LptF